MHGVGDERSNFCDERQPALERNTRKSLLAMRWTKEVVIFNFLICIKNL